MSTLSPIAITIGEPAGIGPDILLDLSVKTRFEVPIVALCDRDFLQARAGKLGFDIKIISVLKEQLASLKPCPAGALYVLECPMHMDPKKISPGAPDQASASWVLHTIKEAALLCLDKYVGAMVTGPVQKSVINDAGIQFSGHTEYIAQCLSEALTMPIEPLMMLTSGKRLPKPLRVALATTHHPLSQVSNLISTELVFEKITALHLGMQKHYAIEHPTLLVSGLNPHAGENGHLGKEDDTAIAPAIAKAQQMGIDAIGPLPADTLFTPRYLKSADAVLAMYHDQGLPVLKYASFGGGINVTLGLPITRTSVDHGTALSLAGTGMADASSLLAAIDEALDIIRCSFLSTEQLTTRE